MKKSVILTLSATALAVTVCTICAYASINVPKTDSEKPDDNVQKINAAADGENSITSLDLPGEISSAAILGRIEDDPESKKNIFISMLNSVDFFDTVQGEFVTTFLDSERKEVRVTYAVDVPNIRSYSKATGARNMEMYYDGDYIYNVLTDKREYRTDRYCPQYTAQSRNAGKRNVYEAHSAPEKNIRTLRLFLQRPHRGRRGRIQLLPLSQRSDLCPLCFYKYYVPGACFRIPFAS